MTPACEDAHSKLVEVVTVADVSDEGRVGKSLLQIWKLKFGHKAKVFGQTLSQGCISCGILVSGI